MRNAITEQGKALDQMHGDTMELIHRHAAEFRQIIVDFHEKFGRIPSADDLIWIASEHAKHNLRKP